VGAASNDLFADGGLSTGIGKLQVCMHKWGRDLAMSMTPCGMVTQQPSRHLPAQRQVHHESV
jgi:hypothetical protein